MIDVEGIIKHYDETTAVNDLSFNVGKGELFGLIGPDGAGKTTVIRILTSLLLPDKGKATVMGLDVIHDFKELRTKIGYMPGRFSLYEDLTVKENLNLFASIFGTSVKENYELISDIYSQIEPFNNRKAGNLSGGMKQKLALSCAMIHAPEVIFLDEPTTGVDPVSRREFWSMLAKLKSRGITILVSTPYMDEASLCDKIALMQSGDILDVNTPEEIVRRFPLQLLAVKSNNLHKLPSAIREFELARTVFVSGDEVHVTLHQDSHDELFNFLTSKGISGVVVEKINPSIEDCFLELMTSN